MQSGLVRHLGVLVLGVAAAVSRRAAAVGEDEWQLAVTAGYARLAAGGRAQGGGLFQIEGQRGITESVAAHAVLGASWHSLGMVTTGEAGITWAVDVMRLVPFLEASAAFLVGADRQRLGGAVGLGGEYFIDRRWAVAAVVRYTLLPLRLGGPVDGAPPGLLAAGVRLGFVF